MSKRQIHAVSIEDFWRALVNSGMKPREAKLQARVASILGSDLQIGGKWFRIAKAISPTEGDPNAS